MALFTAGPDGYAPPRPQLVALSRIWVKVIVSIVSVGGFECDEL